MNLKLILLSYLTILLVLTSCSKSNKWEYKTVYIDSERFEGKDKGYIKGDQNFKNSVSSTTTIPVDSSLNRFGLDGWEIATSYLEVETVFPNLLASGEGVVGLQSNTRPQRLVIIFKRAVNKN